MSGYFCTTNLQWYPEDPPDFEDHECNECCLCGELFYPGDGGHSEEVSSWLAVSEETRTYLDKHTGSNHIIGGDGEIYACKSCLKERGLK